MFRSGSNGFRLLQICIGSWITLSLLIDDEVAFIDIERIAYQINSSILKNIQLFDVYKNKKMQSNKKSYAIRFELQDSNKTLEDKEIDSLMNEIQKKLTKEINAELR